jgi:hypothetical protein
MEATTKNTEDEFERDYALKMLDLIDMTPITIQVYLSPECIQEDFLRLQLGKAVSRNQIKSMQIAGGVVDKKKAPFFDMATKVARLLNADTRSFLFNQVAFDAGVKFPLNYSSLIADHASSLATTLYGGALIARAFDKSPEWMVERYVEAYNAIKNYEDEKDGHYVFIDPSEKLCTTYDGGERGGSHLMIGVGNCLAWRLAREDRDEATEQDVERLLKNVEWKLRGPSTGGTFTDKRRDMGNFARSYFADLKDKKVAMVDKVPEPLIELTSVSTWGIPSEVASAWKKEKKKRRDWSDRTKTVRPKVETEYEPEQVLEGVEE